MNAARTSKLYNLSAIAPIGIFDTTDFADENGPMRFKSAARWASSVNQHPGIPR
jgi:hypothetical protein